MSREEEIAAAIFAGTVAGMIIGPIFTLFLIG